MGIKVNFLAEVNGWANGIVSYGQEKIDFLLADGILYFGKGSESPLTRALVRTLAKENYHISKLA